MARLRHELAGPGRRALPGTCTSSPTRSLRWTTTTPSPARWTTCCRHPSSWRAKGAIAAVLTALPAQTVVLWRAVREGRLSEAQRLHARILPVWRAPCRTVIRRGALQGRGIASAPSRLSGCSRGTGRGRRIPTQTGIATPSGRGRRLPYARCIVDVLAGVCDDRDVASLGRRAKLQDPQHASLRSRCPARHLALWRQDARCWTRHLAHLTTHPWQPLGGPKALFTGEEIAPIRHLRPILTLSPA